jgi:hypothetical protein
MREFGPENVCMPKQPKDQQLDAPVARGGVAWAAVIPVGLFVLLLAVGLALYLHQAMIQRAQVRERQQANEQLGLPRDYPLDVVPLYAGAKVDKTERGDWKSSDGKPMDKWYIHAESADPPDKLFKFYNDLMLSRKFQQSYYSSIPTGFGVNYSDARHDIQFVMETRKGKKLTQLEITLYRLR